MAGIKELIRTEEDNTLSFGNYDTEYQVSVDDAVIENYETNLSGKIVISLELEPGCVKKVQICKK